jgi:hypothetical protein
MTRKEFAPLVADLNFDTPCVIPEAAIAVDRYRDLLYVDLRAEIDTRTRAFRMGRVGIMRCLGWDGSFGYVADLCGPQPQKLRELDDDEAEMAYYSDTRVVFAPLAAYVTRERYDETVVPTVAGNREFYAAALALCSLDEGRDDACLSRIDRAQAAYYASLAKHHDRISNWAYLLTGV